jgi:hypothetical protein
MSGDDPDDPEAGKAPRTEKIGYGKPPRAHCFKPGQSGNPKGRPKGARNKPAAIGEWRYDEIIFEEAFRQVKVRDNGRLVEMPVLRASIRTMGLQAASGNVRASRTLHSAVEGAMRRRKVLNDQYREATANYIAEAEAEIRERVAKKQPIDHISPHPDDFRWDEETALPYIVDPADGPSLEENRAALAHVDDRIGESEKALGEAEDEHTRAQCLEVLALLRKIRENLSRTIARQEYREGSRKRSPK